MSEITLTVSDIEISKLLPKLKVSPIPSDDFKTEIKACTVSFI